MKPDYDRAAIMAIETLSKYSISATPVSPLSILKKIPGVLVVSYQSVADNVAEDRSCVINKFGSHNVDAFTSVNIHNGKPQYLVTYNQMLSYVLTQRALARQLGHIVLGHDGSLPDEVRQEEARCFAHHLLCPRPMIHSIMATGIRFTVEVLGSLTGCYDTCLASMRRLPATRVPAELNRQVRERFLPYVKNFFEYERTASLSDGSALADFGTYMEGYDE